MKKYKLLGADGVTYLSETPGTFGGNGKLKFMGDLIALPLFPRLKDFREVTKRQEYFLQMKKRLLPLAIVHVVIVSVRNIESI